MYFLKTTLSAQQIECPMNKSIPYMDGLVIEPTMTFGEDRIYPLKTLGSIPK